jgi:spermidine/putrescine ABC transporter ATP-binding subunit
MRRSNGNGDTIDASAGVGALRLSGVSKYYGRLCVVDDVNLILRPGEFVSLLGPSGSGKTTTLRIVAGFTRPDSGDVVLDGQDLTRVPPYKRNIGMVFQNYALFPHMTAAANIAFPLMMRRESKSLVKERVDEALRMVRLEGLGDRYPRQLSGGQQQRVALARALSFRPHLLLMDEPLGALDKKLREALQLEVMRICRLMEVTVLYVTHDQEEALVMSDRIAIYDHGRIEQIGTGEDLYQRPNSLFVADFVGESNILRGVLHRDSDAWVQLSEGHRVRVSRDLCERLGLSSGQRAAVVVRPERISLWPKDEQPDGLNTDESAASLAGRVREVFYCGSVRKYVVDLETGDSVTIRVQEGDERVIELSGHEVRVSWHVSDCVVVADRASESEAPTCDEAAGIHDVAVATAESA